MASRHRSREVALQALYAHDLAPVRGDPVALREVFDRVAESFEVPESAKIFSEELVFGVGARGEELDAVIQAHARNWKLSRMGVVDRNLLRLATFELMEYAETPAAVIIDEAIELARSFGDDRSPSFVNGVLDAVAHHVRGDSA